MARSVPVQCPVCRREHMYVPPEYPCSCGAPVTVPLTGERAPAAVPHRSWAGAWTELHCPACGRPGQWPQPEFDCACGTRVRLVPADEEAGEDPGPAADGGGPGNPAAEGTQGERPPFRPLTIRTAYDAVACGARFLRWLGFAEVRTAVPRPASGVDLRGPTVVGLVDPTTVPTQARALETLWLHGLSKGALPVVFSLAGYERLARTRADELWLPLFVLDLAGIPQPVNDPGDALVREGAGAARACGQGPGMPG